jgi:hypothetical protein
MPWYCSSATLSSNVPRRPCSGVKIAASLTPGALRSRSTVGLPMRSMPL